MANQTICGQCKADQKITAITFNKKKYMFLASGLSSTHMMCQNTVRHHLTWYNHIS